MKPSRNDIKKEVLRIANPNNLSKSKKDVWNELYDYFAKLDREDKERWNNYTDEEIQDGTAQMIEMGR